jgi:hypothetical protein
MALRDHLVAELRARNRRFLLAAILALAGFPLLLLLQHVVPPGTIPKTAVIAVSALFPFGFLAYLIWDFEVRPRKLRQRCPICGHALTGYALRAAIDTARCVHCRADLG